MTKYILCLILFINCSCGLFASSLKDVLTLCSGVSNKEPVDIRESFSINDAKIFAHINLNSPNTSFVEFVWTRDGNLHKAIKLPVQKGVSRWRTYCWIGAREGSWLVQVKDDSGNVICEKTFDLTKHIQDGNKDNNNSEVSKEENTRKATNGVKNMLKSLEPEKQEEKADKQ